MSITQYRSTTQDHDVTFWVLTNITNCIQEHFKLKINVSNDKTVEDNHLTKITKKVAKMGLVTNDVVRWLLVLTWLTGCFISWIVTFSKYRKSEEYYYVRYLMGEGLPVARACALTLNLNSMLILLPVCRNLISYLRGSFETREFYRKNVRRQLDKNITFHKLLAYSIIVLVIMHIVAHCFNMQNLYRAKQNTDADSLENRLSNRPNSGEDWVNPITSAPRDSTLGFGLLEQVLVTRAGWTGALLTLTFLLMISSSTEFMRRSYFEKFWYSHHFFVLYFAMLLLHGTGGLVRKQTNIDEHPPQECQDKPWELPDCPPPTFSGSNAAVVNHPSRVIELRMSKKGFNALPGQYIFIKCPTLSKFQWHPFTLTSAPEDEHFSVHIRCVGDWTNALADAVGANLEEPLPASRLPSGWSIWYIQHRYLWLQGCHLCRSRNRCYPFASVLKSLRHKLQQQDESVLLQKVYFFWVCSDTHSFEWFNHQLSELEQCLTEMGRNNFLDYAVCLTRGWSLSQVGEVMMNMLMRLRVGVRRGEGVENVIAGKMGRGLIGQEHLSSRGTRTRCRHWFDAKDPLWKTPLAC
ncbi:putative cytochrome b-245 heavy chain [Apostichopus japonicus]|uniref:Putative cytochrome b-245 heavy chain n=1 Tax=Stichopus japonicus TaxID=307972 RepID=A0A2G8JDS0_STIJA|nr:putative cytochrome b-245 heavy chain [Apostichopus japonicus]